MPHLPRERAAEARRVRLSGVLPGLPHTLYQEMVQDGQK